MRRASHREIWSLPLNPECIIYGSRGNSLAERGSRYLIWFQQQTIEEKNATELLYVFTFHAKWINAQATMLLLLLKTSHRVTLRKIAEVSLGVLFLLIAPTLSYMVKCSSKKKSDRGSILQITVLFLHLRPLQTFRAQLQLFISVILLSQQEGLFLLHLLENIIIIYNSSVKIFWKCQNFEIIHKKMRPTPLPHFPKACSYWHFFIGGYYYYN